jgi:hypothetical protein
VLGRAAPKDGAPIRQLGFGMAGLFTE